MAEAPPAAAASAAGASTQAHAHPHGHAPAAAGASTKLQTLKTNATFLALGNNAAKQPGSVATRSFLKTLRYFLRYMIRRSLRIAKYALIGGTIAFVGAGVLGTLGSGLAFFAAPSAGMGMTMGIVWGVTKFSWRHRPDRFRGGWWDGWEARANAGGNADADEAADAEEVKIAARAEENRRVRNNVWERTAPV